MRQVLEAWSLASEVSNGSWRGATLDEIVAAEGALGLALPSDMKELYKTYNGGDFLGGNLRFDPLFPVLYRDLYAPVDANASEKYLNTESHSLTTASALMRSWHFPVPHELVMFGGNGSENWYGVWLPEEGRARPVVVELGEDDSPDALAIVGDDIASFLAAHSAYYLNSFASDGYDLKPALDVLGVPDSLRGLDIDDDQYFALLNWASPNLPDKSPDSYKRPGLTTEAINEFARLS